MQKNHSLITKQINIKLEWTRTRCDSASKQSQINNRFDIISSAEFYTLCVSEKPLDRVLWALRTTTFSLLSQTPIFGLVMKFYDAPKITSF